MAVVEYILNLKDNLSKNLEGANVHAKTLEHTLKGIGEVIGVLGVSMVAFAGFEALKGAKESWEKMEFSIGQVKAGLKSTGESAGISFEEIEESAIKTAHGVKYAQDEILGMQSVLLTFPSITKSSFQPATDIILDMSTRLGQDLKSSAIQVGKALQDPIRGVTALRRVGVNFNETQIETIKHMVTTNHLASAQALIMKELNLEFGGSAAAGAASDAGFRYKKGLEEIRYEVGRLVVQLQEQLMPAALKFLEWIKASVDWITKHTSLLGSLAKGLGAAWLAFKVMSAVPVILGAVTVAMEGLAYAAVSGGISIGTFTAALNVNPIFALAAAIGFLVAAYDRLDTATKNLESTRQKALGSAVEDEEDSENKRVEHLVKLGKTKAEAQKITQGDARSGIMASIKEENDAWDKLKKDSEIGGAFGVGMDENAEGHHNFLINYYQKKLSAVGQTGLLKKKDLTTPSVSPAKLDTKSKGSAAKSVTINVQIKELVHDFNVQTTIIKEAAGKVKDLMVQALTGAVNDFQIVAGE